MQAAKAPASVRERATDIIVRQLGPVCVSEKLTEAGDAVAVAVAVIDLEATFGIDLDRVWPHATVGDIVLAVEALERARGVADEGIARACERARRARAPLFPQASPRDLRLDRSPSLARGAGPAPCVAALPRGWAAVAALARAGFILAGCAGLAAGMAGFALGL